VAEVAVLGKDHCDVLGVACLDDICIPFRTTRLDNGGRTRLYRQLGTIREGEEGV
jgi:hypothetical protein